MNDDLNTTQQVLRGVMLAIFAGVPETDRARFAWALSAAASNPNIGEDARAMLSDLAQGATALAKPSAAAQ